MAHSHFFRRSYLESLGSQALVDLSDCCCFRSLPRLGELVDQILFERQVALSPLPLDPEILENPALLRALGAAAPLQATAGPGGVGCAWGIERPWDWPYGTRRPGHAAAPSTAPSAPVGGYSGREAHLPADR